MFQPTIDAVVHGDPEAILLVEFDERTRRELRAVCCGCSELMGDLGFSWDKRGRQMGRRGRGARSELQAAIDDMRTSGLNIMMSMKEAGKPVSFVEDCAVPLSTSPNTPRG